MSLTLTFSKRAGRALLDGKDWQDAGMRYTSQLDLLPLGN
jgi:hypothetical protein